MKNFDQYLNEMAKAYPPGTAIHVKGEAFTKYHEWNHWKPSTSSDFIMNIKHSGSKWLEGEILFFNRVNRDSGVESTHKFARIAFKKTSPASTKTLNIIQKNLDDVKKLKDKRFFLKGDEDFLMDKDGEKMSIPEGEYLVTSVDFDLTDKFGEAVIYMSPPKGDGVSVKLSDVNSLNPELNDAQKSIFAKWISNKTGIDVSYNDEYGDFVVNYFDIGRQRSSKDDFPRSMTTQMDYILYKEDAEKILEILKKMKASLFDVSELTIGVDNQRFDYDEFIKLLDINNIKYSFSEIFQQKRGEISAKKFNM